MNPKKVTIDADMKELIPQYLANRESDLLSIQAAHTAGEWKSIEVTAHKISGSAGGYGFDELGEIASRMEKAAKEAQAEKIQQETLAMIDYLRSLEIDYA